MNTYSNQNQNQNSGNNLQQIQGQGAPQEAAPSSIQAPRHRSAPLNELAIAAAAAAVADKRKDPMKTYKKKNENRNLILSFHF